MRMARLLATLSIAISVTALMLARPAAAETVTIGFGTQETTTNTATTGTEHCDPHLLEEQLPPSGHHAKHRDHRNGDSRPSSSREVSADIRQIRQHQVRAGLAEFHFRTASIS